jgi:hypothetical protein
MRRLRSALAAACSGYDGNHIPYSLRGFDVWFYEERPSCDEVHEDEAGDDEGLRCRRGPYEVYLGRAAASFVSRQRGLLDCNATAVAEANRRELGSGEWGYVCCTVTGSSDCVTKVR